MYTGFIRYFLTYGAGLLWCIDVSPDPRTCEPGTPGVCHLDATCTPVTPYVCSATRPMSYRCECNQRYSGDGISCSGKLKLAT